MDFEHRSMPLVGRLRGLDARSVAGGAACVVLAVLPYAHSVALRNVALGLAWLALLAGWRAIAPPRVPLLWLFAVWGGLGGLSLVWALDVEYSASELKTEILYPLLVFVLFVSISDRTWLPRFRTALVATTFLSFVSALIWRFFLTPNSTGAFFNGPGMYSTYLIGVYPFALAWLVAAKVPRAQRWLSGALALVILIGGWITLNRMFWIVIALETIAVIALMPRRSGAARSLALRAVGAIAAVAVFAGMLYALSSSRFAVDPATPAAVAETALSDIRARIWPYALERIAERPLTGWGFGRGALRADFRETFDNPLIWHAHNVVLDYGISMGVPGIVMILAIFGLVLARLAAVLRGADEFLRPYAVAAIVVVIGIFAKSLADDLFYRQTVLLYWAVAGMVLGTYARSPREADRAHASPRSADGARTRKQALSGRS